MRTMINSAIGFIAISLLEGSSVEIVPLVSLRGGHDLHTFYDTRRAGWLLMP